MMNHALLLASTIGAEGNFELSAPASTAQHGASRAAFGIRGDGELRLQHDEAHDGRRTAGLGGALRRTIRRETSAEADMLYFAACLERTLGDHTPPVFQLAREETGRPHFVRDTSEDDARRLQLVQEAYAMYLVLYEERLL